jgi:glycosyltransferase involved in cell wall biosynthesis
LVHKGAPSKLIKALATLVGLCREIKPDVIHAHMMSSAVLGFLASRLCRVPLVTTVHNSFDRHSSLMRLGDIVVAVSEAERRLLLSRGYPERKVVVIHNGPVGSPRETMADVAPPEIVSPCIITVSGLHARKGVKHLIVAFAQVAPEFPDWSLNIIGEGPDRNVLEGIVDSFGLRTRVHFIGPVLVPKPWLEHAEIFALASLAEPFGLVLVEARAAGCAVVASDVGGIPEVLDQGRAGQLVKPGDPAEMAAAFRNLMRHPNQLSAWRKRSIHDVDNFAVDKAARRYLAIYRNLSARAL